MRIGAAEVFSVDLPFRKPFRHAACVRNASSSVFLKLTTEQGVTGFGECLPREYVTGESQESVHSYLCRIVPEILALDFESLPEVISFLSEADGSPPGSWEQDSGPSPAAWCAVDLALLDTFSRAFKTPIFQRKQFPENLRYSVALSAERGFGFWKTLLKLKLYGHRTVKIKMDSEPNYSAVSAVKLVLGRNSSVRVDANMAWDLDQALKVLPELKQLGVEAVEQPLPADEIEGMSRLMQAANMDLIADEGISDRSSLERLIAAKSCSIANIRISKCGGLIASLQRAKRALEAGMKVQIGCQVGESSLLSAANVLLISELQQVRYAEGCVGLFLLRQDPAAPLAQFGYGGKAPRIEAASGIGVQIDESLLRVFTGKHNSINSAGRGEPAAAINARASVP